MRFLLVAAALICASAADPVTDLQGVVERYKVAQAAILGDKEEIKATVLATYCGLGPETSEEKKTIMSREMFIQRALNLSEAQETYQKDYVEAWIRNVECIVTAFKSKDFTLPCVSESQARLTEVGDAAKAAGLNDEQTIDAMRSVHCMVNDLAGHE